MFQRLQRTVLATAACLLILAPVASADSTFRKTGRSGQVYSWAAGHC
ncbi:MAG: hypothetical protein P1V36_02955 [Planctomycetota bacterium]|nr:hypothetical protein [Planctomycetota bacterium]